MKRISFNELEQMLTECRILSIHDINIAEGKGEEVDKSRLRQIKPKCKKIIYFEGLLTNTCDIYYDWNHVHRIVRILLI